MNEGQDTGSGLGGADDRLGFDSLSSVGGVQQTVPGQSVGAGQPTVSNQPVVPSQSVGSAQSVGVAQSVNSMQSVASGQLMGVGQPVNTMQPTGLMGTTPSMGSVGQSVSSGSGDIVLSQDKKPRKWGVIVALVAAVLVIGGLFAVVLVPRIGGGSSANISEDAKLAFNRYANYLLYGEDSDEVLNGGYDEKVIYKFDEVLVGSRDQTESFFENLSNLLGRFDSVIGNTNEGLDTKLEEYKGKLELAKLNFGQVEISNEFLVNEVTNGNLENAKKRIETNFSEMMNSEYEVVRQYANNSISYYQLYIDYLERLKDAGCLNSGNEADCEGFYDEELINAMESYETGKQMINADVVRGCWDLGDYLYGRTEDEA